MSLNDSGYADGPDLETTYGLLRELVSIGNPSDAPRVLFLTPIADPDDPDEQWYTVGWLGMTDAGDVIVTLKSTNYSPPWL